jgi:hypothetical protein
VTVSMPTESASCVFPLGHFEIKTLRCSRRTGKLVTTEVDMLERPMA